MRYSKVRLADDIMVAGVKAAEGRLQPRGIGAQKNKPGASTADQQRQQTTMRREIYWKSESGNFEL